MKPCLGVIIIRRSNTYVSTDKLTFRFVHRSASFTVYAASKGNKLCPVRSQVGKLRALHMCLPDNSLQDVPGASESFHSCRLAGWHRANHAIRLDWLSPELVNCHLGSRLNPPGGSPLVTGALVLTPDDPSGSCAASLWRPRITCCCTIGGLGFVICCRAETSNEARHLKARFVSKSSLGDMARAHDYEEC
jgi:hypothetical protein